MYSHCTVCKAELHPGDVDLERQFVSCSSCGSMFTIQHTPEERRYADGAVADQLPNTRWTYERKEDFVRLSWPTTFVGARFLAALLVCVLVATLPVVFGWVSLRGGGRLEALPIAIAALLLFGYPLLVSAFNRTFIEAGPGVGIQVRNGPLPWLFQPRSVRRRDISQLYAKRLTRMNQAGIDAIYELRVQRPNGSTELLLGNGLSAEEVLFLERTLEQHLGIQDRPVRGEFKPEDSA